MPYAINFRSDNSSANSIRSLWRKCGALEDSPTMEALQYPPHLTFAIYDEIPLDDLYVGFDSALKHLRKQTIRFERLGYFEAPHGIVLWAAPTLPKEVDSAHEAIHREIDPELCRKNYRPSIWIPHCSLATAVGHDSKSKALAIVEKGIDPVEVIFDAVDCASFMPVKVLKESTFED